jgi:hypothetical protein
MMRLFFGKLALSVVVAVVLCCSCATNQRATIDKTDGPKVVEAEPVSTKPADLTEAQMGPPRMQPEKEKVDAKPEQIEPVDAKPTETKPAASEQKTSKQPPAEKEKAEEQPGIVAEIGDYAITKDDLVKRMIKAHQGGHDESIQRIEPVDAKTVLLNTVAEKTMVIQGIEAGLLELDDAVPTKERNEDQLLGLFSQSYLEGKINVTEAEIDKRVKADPKLKRDQARMMIARAKATKVTDESYKQLCEKRNVKKLRYNFPKAAEVYQRLLRRPKSQRRGWWVTWTQVTTELTEQERNLVLATFDGGQVIWDDWFRILHKIPPLKRPKDLATVQGTERLLERALSRRVFLAEARRQGLDKNEDYQKKAREAEERYLLGIFRMKAYEGLQSPTKPEIRTYFDEHKEQFRKPDTAKVDVIWCADLATAKRAKKELDGSRDFAEVREEYSLKKNEAPYNTTVSREGVFFQDLWKAEPGDIVGPVKGLFPKRQGRQIELQVKWRIVKIIEKKPGQLREYSGSVEREVEGAIKRQQRKAIMADCRKKLLEEYPYKIHTDRLKDIDPFDIP